MASWLVVSFTGFNHDRQGGGGPLLNLDTNGLKNDHNQYLLDLKPVNYDICSFVRVGIPSTNLYFGVVCDIL